MAKILEICTDSIDAALVAESLGADRIELCSAIELGGLTPSYGSIKGCCEFLKVPVKVLIRPRSGDFCYSETEFLQMLDDITIAKQLGAQGIVSGLLYPDGSIDVQRTELLVQQAAPLDFTFHRAFDLCSDPPKALEEIIHCGAKCLLSSGQHATAVEGLSLLIALARQAGKRLIIMPGAGINEHSIAALLSPGLFSEFHMTARVFIEPEPAQSIKTGLAGRDPIAQTGLWHTDTDKIIKVKQRIYA